MHAENTLIKNKKNSWLYVRIQFYKILMFVKKQRHEKEKI